MSREVEKWVTINGKHVPIYENGSFGNKQDKSEYNINDRAEINGYDSAAEMIEEQLTENNDFWTRELEMAADVEAMGYTIVEEPNGEYFVIADDNDSSDSEFIVYYEKAGSSMYIKKVKG